MIITIDKSLKEPAYLQLYRSIRASIVSGAVPAGSKLPSKRIMAEDTGLSVISVEHAYSLLADEGYVELRERSGCYVDFCPDRKNIPTEADISETFSDYSFASDAGNMTADNEPASNELAFSVYAKTVRRVLSQYGAGILKVVPGSGLPELRNAISMYLFRSRGIEVSPDRIIIGSGSEYLYSLIIQLIGRARNVALEKPCYEKIEKVYTSNGAKCDYLPIGPDGLKSDALRDCTAGLLHVTPYNSYPSGITATAAKRYEYAAWAKQNDSYIVEDDYDSEFSSAGHMIDTIYSLAPERVIYLNTFSRTIASAIRIGYMILPVNLIDEYNSKLSFYSCTVPVLDQYVLAEYIRTGELERNINRRKRSIKRGNN